MDYSQQLYVKVNWSHK